MKGFSALQTFAFLQSFHSYPSPPHLTNRQPGENRELPPPPSSSSSSSPSSRFGSSINIMTMDDNATDNATQTPTMTPVPLVSNILPPLSEGSRRIYLVRHGETDWNKLGKIQGGGFDIPLNDNGRQQALTTALALEDIPLGVVASSHLSRAKETADILWHRHNATVQDKRVILEGLGEMRFGEFEGLAWRDQDIDPALAERFKTISKELKHDLNRSFPGGGESTKDVQKRAVAALDLILKDFPDEQHIAIVSHGRTNKVLIASTALGDVMQYPTVKQGNTAINVIDVDAEGKWTVQTLNYLEHVKDNVIKR